MNVLVLGGTGGIGSAVVNELHGKGAHTTILCRNQMSIEKAESLGSQILWGDIQYPESWRSQLIHFNGIIHVACGFGSDMGPIDRNLVSAIIDASKERTRALRIIYTGGAWCYGNTKGLIDESAPKHSIPQFNWMVENSGLLFQCIELEAITIHPANVVKKDNGYVPSILHEEFKRSGDLTVPESSAHFWPLVEDKNLARLYVLALEHAENHSEFFGCDESGVQVGDLVRKLAHVDESMPIKETPIAQWIEQYGDWANGYKLNQKLSSRKAQEVLGWVPKKLF